MKATGIIRPLDKMRRVVLPIELRRLMGFDVGNPVEIFTDGDSIILKKYRHICSACGKETPKIAIGSIGLCQSCIETVKEVI